MRLCLGIGTVSVGKSMLRPLIPLYALSLGASPGIVGLLVSVTFVLPLLTALWFGRRLDRGGALFTLRAGTVILLVSYLWLAAVPGLWSLAFAQMSFGLAQLMIVLSAQAMVSYMSGHRSSAQNYARFSSAQSVGQLIGPLLGGIAADVLGFRTTFAVAASAAVLGFAVFSGLPKGSGTAGFQAVDQGEKSGVSAGTLIRNPAVQLGIVVSASVLTALTFFSSFFPLYMESLSYPATLIGVTFSARAFAALFSKVAMSQLDFVSANRAATLTVVTFALAIGVGAIGFSEPLWLLLGLCLVIGACSGISQPMSMSIVADHVRGDQRGLAMGLRLTGNRSVQLTSPILLGLAVEAFGYRAAFALAGVGLLFGALFTVRTQRTFMALDGTARGD